MRWTPDQEQAIAARGSNLLLSAAAGSGKTTVLVERVLSLIREGMGVDRMLIVTFSRAAAADMKDKLVRKLMEAAQKDRSMAEQAEKVERAMVCTLHSYCLEVLRAHFEAAGVDPGFRVADSAEDKQLQKRAMEAVLEQALSRDDPDLVHLLYGRDLDKIRSLVSGLYEFSQSRPDPQAWLDMALGRIRAGDRQAWTDVLRDRARRQLEEAAVLARCALDLAMQGPTVYETVLKEDIRSLDALKELEGYPALYAGIQGYGFQRMTAFRAPKSMPEECQLEQKELAKQARDLRDRYKKTLNGLKESLPDPAAASADLALLEAPFRCLCDLTRRFAAALWQLKAERSVLNFSDLEHAALRALEDPRVVAAQRARFDCVFVDEYQDVSDLQEAVIRKVARPDSLFMVGDVKQSIYRFRQAEPRLFIGKYKDYGAGKGGRLISLSHNFRSRMSVLTLVNRIFAREMSGPYAELQYDDAARLQQGADFPGPDPRTRIMLLEGDEGDTGLAPAESEGALAAHAIWELLDGDRGIRPRDIAVLCRTRSGLSACEQMLRRAGVPCYMDARDGYFDALEVRIMLGLMRAVENRRRDMPLLEVLRSPVMGCGSTDLARIRMHTPQGPFYEAVQNYARLDSPLAHRLAEFLDKLDRWRLLSRVLPLGEWVNRLMMESGYYAYAGGMPGGRTRQGNLDLLCGYANQLDALQSGGLTAFLEYVEEIGRTGGDMGTAHTLGEGDDVVRLMTVHQSKGLEFPIVFGVLMGRSLGRGRQSGELLCHRRLGAGIYCHDEVLATRRNSLPRTAIQLAQQDEDLEEEKRILYVLLTRAKEQLYLVGSCKSREEALREWTLRSRARLQPENCLDMVMPVVDGREQVDWYPRSQVLELRRPAPPREIPDEALTEEMLRAMCWQYPHADAALLPLKLSVSSLAREMTGPTCVPEAARRPSFLMHQSMTAAELGTQYHAALSALDLAALRDDPASGLKDQLAGLLERRLITAPLDGGPILSFLQRDAGRRLLQAKQVQREWPFNLRMTTEEAAGLPSDAMMVVQGVIDCCFLEDGRWVLLDFKTDRRSDEEMLRLYSGQISLYERALRRITGIPVKEKLLCMLFMGRDLAVP